jgi:octaprenyl-diphosphate synthase
VLALLFARVCSGGQTTEATVRYAAAAELLHNVTLLHDDVADESEQRRGAPTIMSLMGPSVSVLIGDYWLVKAMELILGEGQSDGRVIKIFSKTLSDLAEGEMLQLQKAQSGDTDEKDYLRIIYSKTASLFEAACLSAAVSVSAPEEYEVAAREYAVALGKASGNHKLLSVFLVFAQFENAVNGFRLGIINEAAGIHNNHIGIFRSRNDFKTVLFQ